MNFETLKFPPEIKIYRARLDRHASRKELILWLEDYMEKNPSPSDAFELKRDANPLLNPIFDWMESLSKEIAIYEGREFLDLTTYYWINRVKVKNPAQNSRDGDKIIYHSHNDINLRLGIPSPQYTLVYYLQVPDNLEGQEGVLFFRDRSGREFEILPEEGDCLIMKGDLEHVPNYAPNSTKDRIVIAGNMMFQYSRKIQKTVL